MPSPKPSRSRSAFPAYQAPPALEEMSDQELAANLDKHPFSGRLIREVVRRWRAAVRENGKEGIDR